MYYVLRIMNIQFSKHYKFEDFHKKNKLHHKESQNESILDSKFNV